jgi:non-canonical (house-cleaning) NTP pyrophosphatase
LGVIPFDAVRLVAIGSVNTVKIAAARAVIAPLAPVTVFEGVPVSSSVQDQPFGDEETIRGARTRAGKTVTGRSLAMLLPRRVARMIRNGTELGHAMDALVGAHNTTQGAGAVGILTAGLVDRQRAYEILVTYTLAPFLTPEYWP